ncbi:sugar transporter [Aspergillus carlsbadensis]|nr:sugar transporter [Aspergillus carlsbadensis]
MPIHASAGTDVPTELHNHSTPWWRQPHLLKLNTTITFLILYSSAVGYDGSLLNGLQALPQWNQFMDHPTGTWSGFINVVYWMSLGLACPVSSWAANKYGRRAPILLAFAPLAIGTGLQAGAKSPAEWIAGRAVVGIATAFFSTAVPLLVTEIAHPTQRSVITALVNAGFFVGAIVAAWACFGARNRGAWAWKIPCLLQIACPLAGLPGLLLAPESPRWLVSVGRPDAARGTLAKIHAGGDVNSSIVEFEMNEISLAIAAEKEAHESTSYATMVSTPALRRRFFITCSLAVFSQWVGNGVVSYYLSTVLTTVGITGVTDQTLISACLQIWSLFAAFGGGLCVERLGRRPLFLLSCGIMFVSFVIITALSGHFATSGSKSSGLAMIPFVFLFNAGYGIALTPLQIAYPLEIWPFHLRSRGISLAWMAMVLAVIFNVFVNPIALERIGWKYYVVFVAVLVAYGVTVYFCYPETRGYTLEEMAVVFGDEVEVLGAHARAAGTGAELRILLTGDGDGDSVKDRMCKE